MKLAILVVDDNQDSALMIAKLLSAFGYEVDTAFDGPAALRLVAEKRYGIAIIDYQMPIMNGVELFRRIREIQPDAAGVFLTGYTTVDVVYPAIEAGVLRVLSKPVDFEELLPIIEDHVGSSAK
jgi:CheY-like chemotaxis protein